MTRGEFWTVAGGPGYPGKPRPAILVQDDAFAATRSVTIAVFTTNPTEAPFFRLLVEPTPDNGLRSASHLMVDKLTTVDRARLGRRVGRLAVEDLVRLNRALMVFPGLATSPRGERGSHSL